MLVLLIGFALLWVLSFLPITPFMAKVEREIISTWFGQPVSHLIEAWGAPKSSSAQGDKQYLVYELHCTYTLEVTRGVVVAAEADSACPR